MSTPTLERRPPAPGSGRYVPSTRPPDSWWGAPRGNAPGPRAPAVPMHVLTALATSFAALCFGNLFVGLAWWFWPVVGAVAVAALAGELARRVRCPLVLMPLVYVVAGWVYIIPVAARGTGDLAGATLVPSATTFDALRSFGQSAADEIRTQVVPVHENPGLVLILVTGVYLVAALADFIAVGLRRPALAGLPLLALVAVPAAIVQRGVGLIAFVATCVAYLAMLLSSGRTRIYNWAPLPPGGEEGVRRATGLAGRTIGLIALVAALVVPLAIPRYAGIARHHHGGGGGGGSATVVEPVVTLAQQLHSDTITPLLSVRTNHPDYLRLTALEHFDGQQFTLGTLSAGKDAQVSNGLPKVSGGARKQVQATIDVTPVYHQRYLPVPYPATEVNVKGDWRLSGRTSTIFSAQTDTSAAHYTVTAATADPSPAELRQQSATGELPSDVAPSIVLPGDMPLELAQLDAKLTGGLSTEYDKVAAIQEYLRSPLFTYDLYGAPAGRNALVDFLLHDRRGYCEQFAGAMVVLARMAGIPARVAIGFTPGTPQPDGSWLISNRDAHSWPEIWFPQSGWVRFEPTKRDESTTPPAYTFPPAPTTPDPSASTTPSTAPSALSSAGPSQQNPNQPSQRAAGGGVNGGGSGGSAGAVLGWTALGLLGLALLLTPAAARWQRRKRRLQQIGPGASQAAWAEIVDTAVDLGLQLAPNLTPRRAISRLARSAPDDRPLPDGAYQVLLEAAQAEELARYAPESAQSSVDGGRLRFALREWQRSQRLSTRVGALLFPRSLLTAGLGLGRFKPRLPRLRSGVADRA